MILDQFKLDGKVAIVTGAGRGIGQAYALGLAEAGADIAIVDVIDMSETADKVKALGRKVLCVKADLSKGEKESPKIVAKVVKALGRVDILVNNAGIIRREPFVEHSAKNWNDVISINLSTPFFLSQAAARQMIAQGQGGKIINIGSMLSFQGGILIPGYAAAKGGIKSLTILEARHLRERDRAGLHRHGEHASDPRGQEAQQGDSRPHPCWTLGHAGRPEGPLRVPRLPGERLRDRVHVRLRRRLACAVTD